MSEPALDRIGSYRILRRLATGGASDVLLAKAEGPLGFERQVVLKLLIAPHLGEADVARYFGTEAAAYARLTHPNIVRLYDFFEDDDRLVMVLELVDGLSLEQLKTMLGGLRAEIDDAAALYVAAELFAALSGAHDAIDPETGEPRAVVHRDVNPSNVLIAWDGQVKLTDFGVAKISDWAGETRSGALRGTFGYMAPEQVRSERVTPRADVYAAAIIAWELLARRQAIQRSALPEVEVLRAMAEPNLVSLDVLRPDLDGSVREALRRALEPDPARRSVTAEEMVALLRGVVSPAEGRAALMRVLEPLRPRGMTPAPPTTAPRPTPRVLQPLAFDETDAETSVRPERDPFEVHDTEIPLVAHPDESGSDLGYLPVAPPPFGVVPTVDEALGLGRSELSASGSTLLPSSELEAIEPGPTADETAILASSELVRAAAGYGMAAAPTQVAPVPYLPAPALGPSPHPSASGQGAHGYASSPHWAPTVPQTPTAMVPAARRPGRLLAFLFFLALLAGVSVAVMMYVLQDRAGDSAGAAAPPRPTAPSPPTPAPSAAPAPSPRASASPPPSSQSAAPAPAAPEPAAEPLAPTMTRLVTREGIAAGRRVYVDGKVVGQTPLRWIGRCGDRTVRVGSQGEDQALALPCGKELVVDAR